MFTGRAACSLVSLALVLATGCASSDAGGASDAVSSPRSDRTRGSAVVLGADERVAVVANRSAGVVTVFELDAAAALERLVRSQTELDLGEGSEPWAVVIGRDGDTAYVISRRDQLVTRIVSLRTEPHLDGTVHVGAEPTAIAIAPSGRYLYIANWGEGTISVIGTGSFGTRFDLHASIDLNESLVHSGALGPVTSRVGLAHPRALAISDDGDASDAGETLYATEFFSMPLTGELEPGPGYFDRNRQGFVYAVKLGKVTPDAEAISIQPILETGFADATGRMTACFPNQLYAAAVVGKRLFVNGICTSPEGPTGSAVASSDRGANFKTLMHSALFVVDIDSAREEPALHRLWSRELTQREPSGAARMPLIPNDIAFSAPGTSSAQTGCITALGADAVFCAQFAETGELLDIGSQAARYVDLTPNDQRWSQLPVGLALSQQRPYGLVVADNSQSLAIFDRKEQRVRAVYKTANSIAHAVDTARSRANAGRRHFATGLGVWSFQGEAWASCEGCHPDGLSDGVTWFFARGPRRTLSTAGTYDSAGERRVLLWTANADEVHDVEAVVRNVAGGVGGVLWSYPTLTPEDDLRIVYDGSASAAGKPTSTLRNNLNGSVSELVGDLLPNEAVCNAASLSCNKSPVHDWNELDAFVRSVRTPRRPCALDSTRVEHGAEVFRTQGCAACHGGPGWTLSRVFYTPGAADGGSLPFQKPDSATPSETNNLLGRLRTQTYQVAPELRHLNPPAATGNASLRRWQPRAGLDYAYDRETNLTDQLNCMLRDVGTFPSQQSGRDTSSVTAADAPHVAHEVRDDMATLAVGATGFNVPSLLGLAVGAPYFHAGNARTLEELFDPAFAGHHSANAAGFAPDSETLANLTAYLLSIDEQQQLEPLDAAHDFCANLE